MLRPLQKMQTHQYLEQKTMLSQAKEWIVMTAKVNQIQET